MDFKNKTKPSALIRAMIDDWNGGTLYRQRARSTEKDKGCLIVGTLMDYFNIQTLEEIRKAQEQEEKKNAQNPKSWWERETNARSLNDEIRKGFI